MAETENSSTENLSTGITGNPRSRSTIEDQFSPYFLHHSDSNGGSLVSNPLTGNNYMPWSRAMLIVLEAKNKLGFIDGTITKPSSEEPDLLRLWSRNNSTIIAWIMNSVSKEIASSLLLGGTARDIWNDLKDRFQQSNGPRIFQLRREFVNLSQEQNSIGVFFTRLKSVYQDLCEFKPECTCACVCGGKAKLNEFAESEYVMQFLMGLNETYTHARGQVLLMEPIPPISKVYAMLTQEETQRSIGLDTFSQTDQSNSLAMASRDDQKKFKPKEHPMCTHCKMLGHTVDKCYKIHGYPPGYKFKPKTQANAVESSGTGGMVEVSNPALSSLSSEQIHQIINHLSTQLTTTAQASGDVNLTSFQTGLNGLVNSIHSQDNSIIGSWILDSGATRHICAKKCLFLRLRSLKNSTVTLPNSIVIPVHFIGDVQLNSNLVLYNVLYVPSFKFNLISVSAITKESHVTISFFPYYFLIQDINLLKMIGRGRLCNDLYVLDENSITNPTTYVNKVSVETWHQRLGHLSHKCLDSLKHRLHIHVSDKNSSLPCCICPLAKQHRLPFNSANKFSVSVFDLVHCDI